MFWPVEKQSDYIGKDNTGNRGVNKACYLFS